MSNNNNNKVWIVYTSDGHLGGFEWSLEHVCATEQLAKRKLIDKINELRDKNRALSYNIDESWLSDPNINDGCGYQEWEIERI